MLKKISNVILKIFGIGITLCLFAGGLSIVGFIVALCIGGEAATAICVFIHKTYFPWVIIFTSIFAGFGLLGMYMNKIQALTIGSADKKKRKALVLCGGIPQIALIQYLKSKGVVTVLADMNEKVAGRAYADKFYPVSVLDVEGVKRVAVQEKVDFVITVCADQVLQVVAQVSEELGLPCYIDFATAENVSKKSYMKKIFVENGVPTSNYVIMDKLDETKIAALDFPLIVKPVDSYSSRGVKKVVDMKELQIAFAEAVKISRTHYAVVEEFVEGNELTVDVYIENENAHVLCISHIDKIGEDGKFVIHRTRYPAQISKKVEQEIEKAAKNIARAFGLVNSPMLIQLIETGEDVSVVEFCARTGGGDKFRLIEKVSGFDVVKAVADLTLGEKPHYEKAEIPQKYITNEFLYCRDGVLDHVEGLKELLEDGVVSEYFILKEAGHRFEGIRSSGDRVAYYTIETDSLEEMMAKRAKANEKVKVVGEDGTDLLRHDLIAKT